MFGDSKEYQDLQKLYVERVSKPENLDEKIDFGGSFNTTKIIKNASDKVKANNKASTTPPTTTTNTTSGAQSTKTSTPMSTSGAQITTNQRQSRDLAAKNKDVKLNKFSRTQTYGADAKGVKLVPGAKVGQKVDRSTVQTKAAFDFKGIKKGERLGVLTRNQRRKYDLMAAQKNKKTEVKTEPPKETTTPTPTTTTTTTSSPQPVLVPKENKGKLRGGQGGRPLGSTTQRQGGTVKSGVTLFKKGEDAKKFTDKTGFASKVDTVKGKDPRPMGRDAAKRRQASSQGSGNQKSGKVKVTPFKDTSMGKGEKVKVTPFKDTSMGRDAEKRKSENPRIKNFKKDVQDLKTTAKYGSTATIQTQDGKEYKPGDPGYEDQLKKARETVKKSMQKEEFTPYDLVLEYLLATEQVATIEEANYVMTEMDAETIQSIVNEGLGSAIKKVGKTVGDTVKKGIKKLKGSELKGDFPAKSGEYTA